MIATAAASMALLFSVPANGGFAGAEEVRPGACVRVSLELLEARALREVVIPMYSVLDHAWSMPKVDVTCPACVEVVSAPRKLLPNECGELVLRITPSSTPGPHRWGVMLHGGGELPLRIDVTGVIAGLAVAPDRAAFGVCPLGASPEIVAELTWHGRGKIESAQVMSNDDTVHASIEPLATASTASVHLVLDGDVRRARHLGGHVQVIATIRMPDGSHHVVRDDLLISGRVVDPAIQLRPASVFLGSVSEGQSVESKVKVLAVPDGIVSLRPDMPGLHAHMASSGGAIHVRYEPLPGAEVGGVQRGLIRLGLGDPWMERAQIPVTVYVGRKRAE